ncbi:MAG: inorganic diphosphatase [Patescibacteria group bacterium]
MNLWHDITVGENAPDEVNCIVEISKGSHNKYEIDKETGLIKLDRANYGSSSYPFDYGFVPQTLWDDGDALDIVLLTTYPIHPGILVSVRPVAIMEMTDSGDSDNKIIAVPVEDKRWDDVKDLGDLNQHTLKECQDFFENLKNLKGKGKLNVIHGYKGKDAAIEAIKHSQKLYQEKFGKN